jgi:hypothetical protein
VTPVVTPAATVVTPVVTADTPVVTPAAGKVTLLSVATACVDAFVAAQMYSTHCCLTLAVQIAEQITHGNDSSTDILACRRKKHSPGRRVTAWSHPLSLLRRPPSLLLSLPWSLLW